MNPLELSQFVKASCREQGFDQVGICPAVTPAGIHQLHEWVERGYGGGMHYIEDRLEAYHHPRSVLEGVKSLVVMTMNYRTRDPRDPGTGQGRVSRYAWGSRDYHDVIHERLKRIANAVQSAAPAAGVRGVVDTAPLMEREFARLAGLGWTGKNTLLLSPQAGSWFFLAVILTDLELVYDEPFEVDHCGSCTACLDACPTSAFPQPYVLDARRCISYLTIEHRGAIAPSLRTEMHDWVFGCDVCQAVCPWNRFFRPSTEPDFEPLPAHDPMELRELFFLSDEDFRVRFRHTPLWRPRRAGMLRNAAIALGNQGDRQSLDALERGLLDEDPVLRDTCAWAIEQCRQCHRDAKRPT